MDEVLSYVFKEMQDSRAELMNVKKLLNRKLSSNRKLMALTLIAIAYTTIVGYNCREQYEKIEKLNREVKELRREKGE